ncbi:uncharacterized protein EDB93DRAFT_1105168 [Suillus bovinus]|uniref:uncharacterized protein n=1 Tax=Suillus bovinus TaxID=48563 RepID=UPI001B88465C|nr:uncharacterized protein EDB93DRAFT_1105168 [Suillus bovinus]KAG2143842.1 hypothetical protein EDB93DRAFT_1105168 [Suillus bovinus]
MPEQPQMSAFDFDPYALFVVGEQQGTQQSHDAQGLLFSHAQGSSSYRDGDGLSLSGNAQGGSSLFSHAQPEGSLLFGYAQPEGLSLFSHAQGSLLLSHAQGSSSFGHALGLSSFGHSQEPSLYADDNGYNFYDHFWDIPSGPSFSNFPPENHPGQGEIPVSEVVHTVGPARTTRAHMTHLANNMPHETPTTVQPEVSSSSSQKKIKLMTEDINHALKDTKVGITGLKKRRLIDKAIEDLIPQFYGPDDQYHTARINSLIWGADPLLFMHNFYFDENNNIIVHAKFQNRFVMANAIRFVWYWGYTSFLDTSSLKPIKPIKIIIGIAGAATHCALYEQARAQLDIDPFSGRAHSDKFREIIRVMDGLTGEEKIELEQYLQYVLDIRPSQVRGEESSLAPNSDMDD